MNRATFLIVRMICAVSLAALVAGCGSSSTPDRKMTTLYVKNMNKELKIL